jgi:hypothetical protein
MQNPAAVKARQVEVGVKAKDKAAGQAAKVKDRAEEVKKSTMATHLTPNPLRDPGLADRSGALPKDANPSTKDLKNREIQAKASDFTQVLA